MRSRTYFIDYGPTGVLVIGNMVSYYGSYQPLWTTQIPCALELNKRRFESRTAKQVTTSRQHHGIMDDEKILPVNSNVNKKSAVRFDHNNKQHQHQPPPSPSPSPPWQQLAPTVQLSLLRPHSFQTAAANGIVDSRTRPKQPWQRWEQLMPITSCGSTCFGQPIHVNMADGGFYE